MRNLRGSSSLKRCLVYIVWWTLCVGLAKGELLEELFQLPLFQHISAQIERKHVISVDGFGAKGDGIIDDTQGRFKQKVIDDGGHEQDGRMSLEVDSKAFRDAWRAACSSPSQSIVEIPAGNTYLVGPIDFAGPCKSKVTLKVYGSIVAPKDPGIWDGLNPRKWLFFHSVKHLTIDGGGVINGMGEEWWSRSCKTCREGPTASITWFLGSKTPSQISHGRFMLINVSALQAITFHKCNNLNLRNLVMLDSQQMHIAFTNCEEVRASNLKVNAPASSPNTDAIHISSSTEVTVINSMISTGDDCISIVGNSSNIEVRNVSCIAGNGISIGSLGCAHALSKVEHVLIQKVSLSHTKNGLQVKTWQGGSGYVQHIKFQFAQMENVSRPIIIDQYYCDSSHSRANQTSAVKVKNISFTHIKGSSATEEAIRFACSESFPCKEIELEDVQLLSSSGGITTMFCWNARGSTEGRVYPLPCPSFVDSVIEQKSIPGVISYSKSS
ncbi:hypothetical protein Scep_024489 [Stephania cephalantha]|uniref:endo-polygalacturonase n=1 Tax=Stephania cephalantha TaxID=152367 RepID=A0AAP0EXA6_9MAGN